MILGEQVIFTAILVRKCIHFSGITTKIWVKKDCDKKTGIFIGTRTLQNGYTKYEIDEGYCWTRTGNVNCALVVFDPRENPVRVPLDAISEFWITKN